MAIDKSQSPVWVRVTVWVTIFAFVGTAAGVGIFQLFSGGNGGSANGGAQVTAGLDSINAVYEPQVAAIEAQLAGDDENLKVLISLGTTYMNWAYELYNSTDPAAQAQFAPTMSAAAPIWERAYEIDPESKEIGGDLASALYYSGQEDRAITMAREVLEKNPDYATVWFNLGVFLTNSNDTAGATEAFNKAIETDSGGTVTENAKSMLGQLGGQ